MGEDTFTVKESRQVADLERNIYTLSLKTAVAGKCPQPLYPGTCARAERDIQLFTHLRLALCS
jgi:hypothetical protein